MPVTYRPLRLGQSAVIVRKKQRFEWDHVSLNQLMEDIGQERTRDIPDNSQDPLLILMAKEQYEEYINQLKEERKDNES